MSPPRTTKVYKVRFGGRSAYVASEYSWRRSRHIGDGYVILFLLRVQSSHDTAAEAQETRGDCTGLYARVDTRHKGNGRGVVICLLLYFNGMLLLYFDVVSIVFRLSPCHNSLVPTNTTAYYNASASMDGRSSLLCFMTRRLKSGEGIAFVAIFFTFTAHRRPS